ncbi:MAG: carboxypeptidase-like regulatory domain-containing protein, partial [Muribaculaceae bacterium]|nr:carboxypeptidase-like regulatory domain-containing protein [Muribaculaceae bacterium]
MRKECRITLAATAALSLLYVTDVKADSYPVADNSEATASVISPAGARQSGTHAERTIEGIIVDKTSGEPLIGATVLLKGQSGVGTRTDFDGKFRLSYTLKKDEAFLVVSYVGYQSKEVPIAGVSDVKIELDPATQSLNEVVVTGSGVQKKVSVTGAISSVSGLELKSSTSALTLNLAGKFAGVYANNSTGEPGSGADFYIRGISNFAGKSATPLILLDDVEISASDLNNIPAENIQSFSVLKDASATAIYGARGANGVMIITTKTGDYNTKTQINVNVENSFNFMGKLPDFVDGPTYMEMYN